MDCQIRFWDDDGNAKTKLIQQYLNDNLNYFLQKGYTVDDPRLTTGNIKLGQLRYTDKEQVLAQISCYDNIQSMFLF